ncbi:kinase-like protein [Phellopilus nigrolimitatus]|nr:kinase-like protein [Phellopilus nigrolimitatus]
MPPESQDDVYDESGMGISQSASPFGALVVVPHNDAPDAAGAGDLTQPAWRTILSDSHQVVLYNSDSHALSVRPLDSEPTTRRTCPYCNRPLEDAVGASAPPYVERDQHTRAPNYFQLLEIANETNSRPSSLGRSGLGSSADSKRSETHDASEDAQGFKSNMMAEGYFNSFFKEEYRLGMGANGSVFLCQHVLDGNPLGYFAVKKIAVGQSHSYLIQVLREIRLLERLRHPNIVTYHHAWLETHQFSSFGPKVPTLFVLMQWAEGGSLDDFIEARLGRPHASSDSGPLSGSAGLESVHSRSDRIRAFRAAQSQPEEERERQRKQRTQGIRTAVHLLSAEEAKRLFTDVASGLAFLHDKSILHLDLKPGNVLLTWDEEALIPRAMLSDFGTSRDMIQPSRSRSGNTGTLEYTAPESLPSPRTGLLSQVDSKADMWSLGMILHMLLFFHLPYHYCSDGDRRGNDGGDMERLEKEVLGYAGFKRTSILATMFERRGLPVAYLILLESLLNKVPKKRPSSEQILRAIREGNFDPLPMDAGSTIGEGTIVPRMSSPSAYVDATENGFDNFPETGPVLDEPKFEEYERDTDGLDLSLQPEPDTDSKGGMPTPRPLPMLMLPPSPNLAPPDVRDHYLVRYFARPLLRLGADGRRRAMILRAVKSVLLVIKILTLLSICPEGRPEPIFACFITTVAISDTWSDDLWLTVLLAILHVVILRLHCVNSKCCV